MEQLEANPFKFTSAQLFELVQPWPGYATICKKFWSDPEILKFSVPILVAAINAALIEYTIQIEDELTD